MSSFQQAESMAAVAAEAEQEQPEAVDDENAIEVISVDQDDASEIKIEVQEWFFNIEMKTPWIQWISHQFTVSYL